MKLVVKQILLYLFIFSINISLSQTNITNKDYKVTDDVIKIEQYDYDRFLKIEYSSISMFQNGFIQKQLNDGAVFTIAGNTDKNYSYLNKEYKINNNEYVIIEFAGLKFSNAKKNFKILQNSTNSLEFEYYNGRKNITAIYQLTTDNLIEITEPDLWFEIKTFYNKKGQLVLSTKSKSNSIQEEKNYNYDNNGFLEKIIIENFTENSKTEKHYEYELDEKGNWIKRIEYELIPNTYDEKTFTTRKLTYKNGEVTGGYLDYNNDNFFTLNPVYFALLHPDDKVKDCISGDCQNGFGKKTFNEKDVYEGDFSVGLMSGKGTYTYGNGNKYEGDFKSGYINGQGKFTFASGDLYEGSFVMNQRSGFGTYTFKNGDKYVGNWIKGYQDGKCTFYDYKANIKQEAIYKEGKVVEVLNKVAISETKEKNTTTTSEKIGCISGDCQNGFGKIVYENGDIYEGNFTNSMWNGDAKFKWKNGDTYSGTFKNNTIEGFGILKSKEKTHTGYFKNNLADGKGTTVYLDGGDIKGNFKEGKIDGKAFATLSNGDTCDCNYVNGLLEGYGTYVWLNGNKYEGEFKNDLMEGKGTYFDYKINKKYEVIYKNSKIIQTISTSNISETNSSNKTGITWTKNATNTEYWLYDNGVLKEGQTFWVDNSLYVSMQQTNELYFLENFKTQTAGPSHAGVLLPFKTTNGFWYKNNAGGATSYNNKGEVIKNLEVYKYTTNGIDVLLKGKDETETLLLKNFKNAEVNKIYPAEIYKPTTTASPTSSNKANNKIEDLSFQAEIESCKLEESPHNCIFKKFNETHAALKKSGIDTTTLDQKTISNLNAIGKYDVELLFNVLFKSKVETTKLTPKLDADVKLKLKAYAQKIKDDYAKTHTNEVPESLKNSVRKQ